MNMQEAPEVCPIDNPQALSSFFQKEIADYKLSHPNQPLTRDLLDQFRDRARHAWELQMAQAQIEWSEFHFHNYFQQQLLRNAQVAHRFCTEGKMAIPAGGFPLHNEGLIFSSEESLLELTNYYLTLLVKKSLISNGPINVNQYVAFAHSAFRRAVGSRVGEEQHMTISCAEYASLQVAQLSAIPSLQSTLTGSAVERLVNQAVEQHRKKFPGQDISPTTLDRVQRDAFYRVEKYQQGLRFKIKNVVRESDREGTAMIQSRVAKLLMDSQEAKPDAKPPARESETDMEQLDAKPPARESKTDMEQPKMEAAPVLSVKDLIGYLQTRGESKMMTEQQALHFIRSAYAMSASTDSGNATLNETTGVEGAK